MLLNKRFTAALMVIAALMLLIACRENPNDLPGFKPTPYSLELPPRFPLMEIPDDNPLTVEGVNLGRMLYYDAILDKDGKRSCSSCHLQSSGFTTPGTNVLPHLNLGYSKAFLWEGGKEGSIEDLMLFEVEDFMQTDISKLNNHPDYPDLFKKAFNTDQITSRHAAYALAQFFRTMISGNSKFDRHIMGLEQFSPAERNGMMIFFSEKGDCFHCHGAPLFSNYDFHNIGLDDVFDEPNRGRFNVTGNPDDMGKFRTPTLRNVEFRESYMHDGRFKTLEQVIEHYNSGIKASSTLDPIMSKNNADLKLHLTEKEKADLVAFLKTLTDHSYTTNPKLSNPF